MIAEEIQFAKQLIAKLFPRKGTMKRRVLAALLEGPCDTAELLDRVDPTKKKLKENFLNKEVSRARKEFEKYYLTPRGFAEPYRIEIPNAEQNKSRSIEVLKNIPPQSTLAFWAGHLANGKPTKLVAAQPLFFQVEDRGLILHHDNSDGWESDEVDLLRSIYADLEESEISRVRPYVALADVRAVLSVFRFFESRRGTSTQTVASIGSADDLANPNEANLFIIGTPFNSEAIRQLEIDALAHRGGGSSLRMNRTGTRISTTMADGEYRAWVVRRWLGPTVQTLINVSESVVIEAVCDFLTSDKAMSGLISERWRNKTWLGFPAEFRIEFGVSLTRDGRRAKAIRVVSYDHMPGWAGNREFGPYHRAGGAPMGVPMEWTYPWKIERPSRKSGMWP